jgi:2-polyprenyl-3-methyl-5-hydroxy-6-metoxy-1,4-benzoquinol methylase
LTVAGIDMSFLNIVFARAKNNIPMLIIGDEYHLCRLSSFDVVTTTSVLCHIQDISKIISEMKRIAHKSIVICETTDIVGEFYYAHNYESFGFEFTGKEIVSGNDANYKVYVWKK